MPDVPGLLNKVFDETNRALRILAPNGSYALAPDDEAYGVSWNGSTEVPTKNALYDKIESIVAGGGGLTQEDVEDIVGLLIDDNSDLDWTYDDATGSLVAVIKAGSVTNAMLAGSIALAKLATDPLARANHTGTQLAATISDFNTAVRTNRLDQMAAPTASVAMNAQKITGLADPSAAQDAMTKASFDAFTARFAGVRSSSNQTVNNSITTVGHSELLIAVAANTVVLFSGMLWYESSTVADFRVEFAQPAGATMKWTSFSSATSATVPAGMSDMAERATGVGKTSGGAGAGVHLAFPFQGILIVGATAGNLQVKFAQSTAEATDTIVLTDSFLEGRVIFPLVT